MKWLIISIILLMFIVDLIVSLLNYAQRKQPIKANVNDIYDNASYQKWLAYSMENLRFSLIKKAFNTVILLVIFLTPFFSVLNNIIITWTNSELLNHLLFLFMYVILMTLLNMPFKYYNTFVIEEKYGFNKTTRITFIFDQLKGLVLGGLLLGGIITAFYYIYSTFSNQMWLFVVFSWAFLSVLIVVFSLLNTRVFIKIFNRLRPLEDGSLKKRIDDLADRLGFNIKAISVIDASRRSTKLNAFFSGFGKTKDIVLFDTLINKLTEDEIMAVLAHELGHAKHKDVLRMLLQQIFVFALYMTVLGLILTSNDIATSFEFTSIHLGFSLILFFILINPLTLLISIPINIMMRKAEFKADAYATTLMPKSYLISALKTLSRENYSNLNPHPLYVYLHYTHPPLSERLEAIEKQKE
jgi:STE24 endopeptidase